MQNGLAIEMTSMVARDDPDFFIHQLYPLDFFGTTVYITTTHICTFIVMMCIAILAVAARRSFMKAELTGVRTNFAVGTELVVDTLMNFVQSTMGKAGKKYKNYIFTLFVFILFSNISGIFGLRPPTADYGTTLCIALITFVMIQYAAIRYKKWHVVTELFEPIFLFFPINVISEISTPISLSLRLFGNILSGTVLMALYYGLIPWLFKLGIPAFLHVYFDLFSGAIQAYVFCMLTMVFISNKRDGQ